MKSPLESLLKKMSSENLVKGGPGSGKKGHTTAEDVATPSTSKFKAHLDNLKNQPILSGKNTASGKPLFLDLEDARAAGYSVEDHSEALNIHHDMAERVTHAAEKFKTAGREVPPEVLEIAKFHSKKVKEHMNARDRLQARQETTESVVESRKKEAVKNVKKSITQMGNGHGDRDINLASFEGVKSGANAEWMERLYLGMKDFDYGEVPRDFELPKGVMHLSCVDDGLYSGFFTKIKQVEDGILEDNANVRIERVTIPELVALMEAKEWIEPFPEPVSNELVVVEVPEMAPEESLAETLLSEGPSEDDKLAQKIEILKLVNKLIGQ